MFIGEFLCFVVFLILRFISYHRNSEAVSHSISISNCIVFVLPAICDMIGTAIIYIGLTLTYASSFQMLRGKTFKVLYIIKLKVYNDFRASHFCQHYCWCSFVYSILLIKNSWMNDSDFCWKHLSSLHWFITSAVHSHQDILRCMIFINLYRITVLVGSVIIFTALLSVAFNNRIIQPYMWLGMLLIICGLVLVGVSDIIFNMSSAVGNTDINGIIAGENLVCFLKVCAFSWLHFQLF